MLTGFCRKLFLDEFLRGTAVSEHVEASLELARMVLINVGVNKKERETILGDFRRTYHAQIDDVIRSETTNGQI